MQLTVSVEEFPFPLKTCPKCNTEYEDNSAELCPADQAALRTIEKDPLVGSRLADRYEIESVIGRGGMGVVYRARQELMDRNMAIKMLHSHMVAEPESVKRFFREAKTVSQVRHHHIITLYDFGMSPKGQPYIVMDYLEGTSLKNEVKENGPLPFERADILFRQVVEGLAAAHAMDVVHRDLKPENIMLSKQGDGSDWVTLVDFGLSKLKDTKGGDDPYQITRVGDVCGSPPYMSPEQCLSSRIVDPRSDIYSLAIVVYESLSGKLPFSVKSAIEMLDCHLYVTPIPLTAATTDMKVCTEVSRVLNKALEKDPEKRHQTIDEFGSELHDAIGRDSLKLRAIRHRIEVASLQGMLSEASVRVPIDKTTLAGVLDGVHFLKEQANIEQQGSTIPPGTVAVTKSQVMQSAKTISAENNYDLADCPYCGSPLREGYKFCLNCQRQLASPQELAKLRQVSGKNALPARRRGDKHSATTYRTREMSNRGDNLVYIQKALWVVLFFGLAYATYSVLATDQLKELFAQFGQTYFHPRPQS